MTVIDTSGPGAGYSAATCLARIDAHDGSLGAVVALDRERAMADAHASAERWQRGTQRSLIDGIPMLVKANIAIAGLPWSAGIAAYRNRIASQDAPCVARLRAAGAVILGLTNMDEGALGANTANAWLGRTDNPAAPGFSAGGSSGGSAAAVAAGFCAAALGTDTIGSVRIPAAYCGVVGHKPAYDAANVAGVTPLAPSLDTIGVLGSTIDLCRSVGSIAFGGDRTTPPMAKQARLAALDTHDWPCLSAETVLAFERTVEVARSQDVLLARINLSPHLLAQLQKHLFMLAEIEGADVHGEALTQSEAGFSPGFRRMMAWGAGPGRGRRDEIRRTIEKIVVYLTEMMTDFDALLLPTVPEPAFPASQQAPVDQSIFVAPASALGWPATAFPIGRAPLPLSAQIVSRSEALCLSIAERLSAATQA